MKFIAEIEAIRPAVNAACLAPARTTIPVLQTLRLIAGERLEVAGTDMDIEIASRCEIGAVRPGSACADAETLKRFLATIPAKAKVEVERDDNRLTLRSGRARCSVATLPAENFPTMSRDDRLTHRFDIPGQDFADLIERTAFAASTESTRYYLNGIYLAAHDNEFDAVATNGSILVRRSVECPRAAGMPSVILPTKTAMALKTLIGKSKSDLSVAVGGSLIEFNHERTRLTSKVIDAAYPDYERAIPRDAATAFTADSEEFRSLVDRIISLANDKEHTLRLAFEHDGLTLSARSTQNQLDASDTIACANVREPRKVGVNGAFLRGILGAVSGGDVSLANVDGESPIVIRGTADRPRDVAVLMPMRV